MTNLDHLKTILYINNVTSIMVAMQHSLRLCLVLKNLRENVIKRKY